MLMNKILRYSFVALMAMLFGNSYAAWEKATSIAVGDVIVIAVDNGTVTKELKGIGMAGSNSIGEAEDYTGSTPAGLYPLSVVAGSQSGSFAFKNGDNYLSWTSGNTLTTSTEINDNSSWTVTFNDGVPTINNVQTAVRDLSYNASSPRFACYGNTNQTRVTLWKQVSGGGSTKKATTIEFSEGYVTRATCGKDESVNLPTATVKSEGAAVAGATVTWESNKTDIATIDDNKVNIANGTQGEVTIKASYAGNDTYDATTKSYKLTVYKGTGLLKELVKEVTNGNEKWDNGGEFQSYWFVDLDNGMTSVPNTVTFASGQYIYLTDGENNLLFYGTNSKNLKKGDKVSGDLGGGNLGAIWGTLKRYNKLPEFVFTDMEVKVESEGNAVEPKTITVDKLADNINAYLKIVDAEFVSAGSGKNLNFKVGDIDLLVYNQFNVDASGLEAGSKYTLEGMGAKYNDNNQLYPISFTKQGGGSGAIYSWESPEGTAAETGGKATYENGETDESKYRVNYKNGDYYTICINGKKANMDDAPGTANGGYILVTLDNELKTDDAIELTGYITKNEAGKEASIYFLFEKGDGVDDEYIYGDAANIDPAVGGKISTHTFKVPAASNGSKSFKMSRNKAGTNVFLTKIVITSGGSTGINTVKTVRVADGAIYNLAGQKVDKSYKGVVIMNGKKMIQK